MSTQGIEVEVTFRQPAPFTDEWLEAIYTSLEKNFALVSVDMCVNEDESKIGFLFGVNNALDTEDFTENVARDAIEKAMRDAAGPNKAPQSAVSSSKVLAFA